MTTPIERLAARHRPGATGLLRELVPAASPKPGQQYRFEVDLDACTGCKACVVACNSMNGLDEDESWRWVGLLHGIDDGTRYQQTVTTGCHHCVDPACLSGCPVDAYEKDPVTGIVVHLDDQCIGCSYCTLTCPYEVPKFNKRLGIVRKCDMCHSRLAEGEAPACASACPNGAITIGIVDTVVLEAAAATGESLVPGAPPSSLTVPSTEYRSSRRPLGDVVAADRAVVRPGHAHDPLTVMLVLTQLAVGSVLAGAALGVVAGLVALGASVLHLGRPRYAWRAVIGLRHSWLSREVVAFGAFAGAAVPYAITGWSPLWFAAATAGVLGVWCSVMLYARTGRQWWRTVPTTIRFAGTTAIGALLVRHAGALAAVVAAKVLWELAVLRHRSGDLGATARLLRGTFRRVLVARVTLAVTGAFLVVLGVWPAALLVVAGELVERRLFFTASVAPRMPGMVT